MAASRPFVYVPGLAELRRDLRATEPAIDKEIRASIKDAVEDIAADAGRRAPKGTRPIPDSRRPKVRLAQSIKASTMGARAVIRSRLPYANVHEWGGTTGRGHSASRPGSVKITARHMVADAAEAGGEKAVKRMGDNLDAVFRRHGWR